MINDPHINVANRPIPPSAEVSAASKKTSYIPALSPAMKQIGRRMIALNKLVYQESKRALPSTTLRLCLMTTECVAVIAELATP